MRMTATLTRFLALAALIAVPSLVAIHATEANTSLADIRVAFKLDPRITQGLHMGERWVSPATYTCVNAGTTCTVDAKVYGVDANGKKTKISPEWIPANPEIVTVSPSQGNAVRITMLRAGETSLKVTFGDFSKELFITVTYKDNRMLAGISRTAPPQ